MDGRSEGVPRIIAAGELLWDILPAGPRMGGAPANFAVMSARLGNRVAMVSGVGDDEYGRAAEAALLAAGLDLSHLQRVPGHPTGTVKVSFSAEKQPIYTIEEDVAWDFVSVTADMLQAAKAADAVCFGTLGQRHEASRAAIRNLVEAASPECARVCDVNLRMPFCTPEVLAWSIAHATLIKLSDEELPKVFSMLGELEPLDPEAAAQALLERYPGCKLIAVSLGPQGSLVATRRECSTHPGFPIMLADTVGAGDAFTAGVVHAYLRGASLAQMAKAGNLCGSFVASQPGATPALPAVLLERIQHTLEVDHEP